MAGPVRVKITVNFCCGALEHDVISMFSSGFTKVMITFPPKALDMRLFN